MKIRGLRANNTAECWVMDISYGFIAQPDISTVTAMMLIKSGVSENTIRLLTQGVETFGVDSFCFKCDGDFLAGWPPKAWLCLFKSRSFYRVFYSF